MSLLWFPIGLALPTVIGWLAIRLTEAAQPILFKWERWLLASTLGVSLTTYLAWLSWWSGFGNYSKGSLLLLQIIMGAGLGWVWHQKRQQWPRSTPSPLAPSLPLNKPQKIMVAILAIWVSLKVIASGVLLIATPPYLDDVFSNWNLRGKIYFTTHEHIIAGGGTLSYPGSVPLFKTWLAHLNGGWHEGLVNTVHIWWYLVTLSLMYYALRRSVPASWAVGGTYLLSSLPLYLMHGTFAYADLFLSLHILAALMPLMWALKNRSAAYSASCLRLSALITAGLIYTKNEALLLHLPALLAVGGGTLWRLQQTGTVKIRQSWRLLGIVALVLVPWVTFKWLHGLPFGNAKSVTGLNLSWHGEVAGSIAINTFLEGNWHLLFPVLLSLLIWQFKLAFRSSLTALVAYFCLLYLGQLPIYFFTGLAHEALKQTGYARGLIQITPVAVVILVLLAHATLSPTTPQISNSNT